MPKWVEGGTCTECGADLGQWHSSAKTTCSEACRKRRQRRLHSINQHWLEVMNALNRMRGDIKRRDSEEILKIYTGQLIYLKTEINDLLLLAKDKDALDKQQMMSDMKRRRA